MNFKLIEQYWHEYKNIDKAIRYREFELFDNNHDVDVNAHLRAPGFNNSADSKVVKKLSDKQLNRLLCHKEVMQELYDSFDEETRAVIDFVYLNDEGYYNWIDVKEKFHYSKSMCYRKRKFILQKTQQKLGLF